MQNYDALPRLRGYNNLNVVSGDVTLKDSLMPRCTVLVLRLNIRIFNFLLRTVSISDGELLGLFFVF